MLYDLYLVAYDPDLGKHVLATMIVDADTRDDAIDQRPADWPISRTRAHVVRYG